MEKHLETDMRKIAIAAGILAAVLLVLNLVLYDRILQDLPVVRGINAQKSVLLSIRILIINILTLTAFLTLANSMYRSQRIKDLSTFGSLVLIFIMGKMLVEFIGLFHAKIMRIQMYPLLATLLFLLIYGALRHKYLFNKAFWKTIRFNTSEKIILTLLLIAYVVVNIPVLVVLGNR
jgi:hypothetical protein